MEEKNWWQSKLIWMGVIEILIGVLAGITGLLEVGAPLTIAGILTILLRVVTKSKIVTGAISKPSNEEPAL